MKSVDSVKDTNTVEYWRHPTPSEIKFGCGAIHWITVETEMVRKPNGKLKKWFIHSDGLRYNLP